MGKSNIVLIGMPSSGKSTVGKYLSRITGRVFVDTDALIKQRENRELKSIVIEDGLERFLEIQKTVILELNEKNLVISTGGSVIYNSDSMEYLKRDGVVVFLKLGLEEIRKRLEEGRRFARTEGQSFEELYNERMPLYRKYADISIECSGKSVEDIAEIIIQRLQVYMKA